MSELTFADHARLGCEYLDELIRLLEKTQWEFTGTFSLVEKISLHATALGLLNLIGLRTDELDGQHIITLLWADPITGNHPAKRVHDIFFAQSSQTYPKKISRQIPHHMSFKEQSEFRDFVENAKRELSRLGSVRTDSSAKPVINSPSEPTSEKNTCRRIGKLRSMWHQLNAGLNHAMWGAIAAGIALLFIVAVIVWIFYRYTNFNLLHPIPDQISPTSTPTG